MSARDSHVLNRTDAGRNAEVLERRSSPYTGASDASFRVKWDWHKREPSDLREAVRMARKAYSDEVPDKLHDAAIGDDGTPRMTARATGYIFGNAQGSDAARDPETGQPADLVSYYHAPFRAALERCERGSEAERFMGAVVRHITIGGQGPREALIAEGIPRKAAGFLAMPVLSSFLRGLSDLRLDVPREGVS